MNEEKKAVEALKQEKEHLKSQIESLKRDKNNKVALFQHLFNALDDAVFLYSFHDKGLLQFVEVNDSACSLYGYTRQEFNELKPRAIVFSEDEVVNNEQRAFEELLKEKSYQYYTKHTCKSGQVLEVEVYSKKIEFAGQWYVMATIKKALNNEKTRQDLENSLKSYKALFNSTSDTLYVLDSNGVFVDVNASAEIMYGYSRQEFIGKTPEFVNARGRNDMNAVFELMNRVLETGKPEVFDFWGKRKNGEVFPKEVIANRARYFEKDYLLVTARDITERKEAVDTIKKEKSLISGLFDTLPNGVTVWDWNGNLMQINKSFTEITGYTRSDINHINKWFDLAYRDSGYKQMVRQTWEDSKKFDRATKVFSISRKDGQKIEVEFRAVFLDDDRAIVSIIDITDQVRHQMELNESKENYKNLYKLLRSISDNMEDFMWAKDKNKKYIFTNQSICDKLLIADNTEEPVGKTDMYFAEKERKKHPNKPDWHTFGENCQDSDEVVLKTKRPGQFDEYGNIQGAFLFLDVRKSPLYNENGEMIGTVGSARDVTKEKELFKEIEKRKNQMQAIFDTSPDAIVMLSPEGFVNECNEQTLCMFKTRNKNEIIGHSFLNSVHKEDHGGAKEALEMVLERGIMKDIEFVCKRRNNTSFPANISASVITDQSGKIYAINCIVQDISARKEFERKIIVAMERAEESDRLKSAFLTNMSHEIRTPMNGIIGFTKLLDKQGISSEKQKYYKRVIRENGKQLLSLVSDILDISSIETNKLTVKKEKVNVTDLVTQLHTLFSNQPRDNTISFTFQIPQNGPFYHVTDQIRLKQILTNLLSNAFKFTQKGFIKFGFDCNKNYIEYFVEDTGIGISAENIDRVFERFHQEEMEITKRHRGAGLGLSISKKLVELLGGSIFVQSQKGQGSRFFFRLPVETKNH